MTRTDDAQQTSAPAAAILRPQPPRMPRASLPVMLKTSTTLRRLLPSRLVVARAERGGRRLWREHEPSRAHALRTMAVIVTGTEREGELERLAERYLVESEAWKALFWQPWPAPRMDERSRELLAQTCGHGRGVVLSACHLGPYFRKAVTLRSLGVEPYVVSGDWFLEEPSKDHWGRRLARWRRGVPDFPLVRPRGSFPLLASVLEQGEAVLVYYDLPGRVETPFLGKPVMLVDGTARLAAQTGSTVLPLRSIRKGHEIWLEAFPPLQPRDFSGSEELHRELARVHERLILEEPGAMSDPAEFGWEQEATPTIWRRPRPGGSETDRGGR